MTHLDQVHWWHYSKNDGIGKVSELPYLPHFCQTKYILIYFGEQVKFSLTGIWFYESWLFSDYDPQMSKVTFWQTGLLYTPA